MLKKGDMLKCYLTGKDEAVVGVYKATHTMNSQSAGVLIGMECSARENPKDCEFYERCKQRLKYIIAE